MRTGSVSVLREESGPVARLSQMPGIGKVMERRLGQAGIDAPGELLQLGSKEAFGRLRRLEGDT